MFVAMQFIQAKLHPMDTAERSQLSEAEFAVLRDADLGVLIAPYSLPGHRRGIQAMLLLMACTRMSKCGDATKAGSVRETLQRLMQLPRYREGVVAQFFYVGAQIMCWTFIIQYGTRLFTAQGMDEKVAEVLSQEYNIVAMVLFCSSRFVCTYLLRFFRLGRMLAVFAALAALLPLGVIGSQSVLGLYCLVGISACMSLMFPTIYGIALEGLGEDAKFGAVGLIMSILGGSVLPPLQAYLIDQGTLAGWPAVNVSFVLPLICFGVVMAYGVRYK